MLPRLLVASTLLFVVGCSGNSAGSTPTAASDDTSAATTPDTTAAPTTTPTTPGASTTSAAPTTAAPATTAAATTLPATTVATATPPPVPTTVACRVVAELPVGLGAEPDPEMAVRRGDCGPGVVQIQQMLRDRWQYAISADGQFGPATEAAVRDFQSSFMGVTADGIVGPMTWVALNSDDFDPSDA